MTAGVMIITIPCFIYRKTVQSFFNRILLFVMDSHDMVRIMKISSAIRRTLATVLLTAGLAYPVCAAVCPKGIGGCPTPGRCFLFTDADLNRLCDYTRPGSPSTAPVPASTSLPVQTPAAAPVTATTAPDPAAVLGAPVTTPAHPLVTTIPLPDTTAVTLQNTTSPGFLETIQLAVPLAEIAIFLVFALLLFVIVRKGVPGIQIRETLPALAFSSLFALGLSLVTTSLLAGGTVAGTVYALWFVGAGTPLAGYLWYKGVMTRQTVLPAAGLATLAGFVFSAPVMPLELGGLVNVITGVSALNAGIIVICGIIALTLVLGRVFCGTLCPVGSLQELAYAVPVKKIVIRRKEIPELVRLAVFVATVAAALSLVDLMASTGLYDLFSLTFSASFAIAAVSVLLSVFLYRPICRFICPFGVLFSVFAEFSVFRLRRNESCISCRKCEKTCPARTAGEQDSKRECYLCGWCTSVCPVRTALSYRR
jgi:ferredoxin-type protein NapH